MDASQDVDCAVPAAPTAGAYAQLEGELVERICARAGALLDGSLSDSVANADVQGNSSRMQTIII